MGFLTMKLWEGVANAFKLFFSDFRYFVSQFFHPLNRNDDYNPFSTSPIFGQVQKFFLENLLLARFLYWRDISRAFF